MKIRIHTQETGKPTGDLFGIFFEDLNHAADGGLYPELVQNRSFEFSPIDHPDYDAMTGWQILAGTGRVRASVQYGVAVSEKNPHYLCLDIQEPGEKTGVRNDGFAGGMYLKGGEAYRFSCYAKREQDLEEPMTVALVDEDGRALVQISQILTSRWERYEMDLIPLSSAKAGHLEMYFAGRGKVYLDLVSIMPEDTYKGLPFRKDLAEALEALHPKFLRFPGGCLVHDGALDPRARDSMYRWKNTIGPIEDRPARRNNWNYNQTLGLGFYEYFLLAEAIGAKPVPVISAGYDPHHHREAPITEMWPWTRDALHLIEFANGDDQTEWGARRAAMGHPEPFGLEYLAIGNEEVGEAFFDRYKIVLDAVRRKYPDIKIIGTAGPFNAGGEFERGWARSKETNTDIVDEHYYMAPEWFLKNHDRYASYDANGPKVFLGEYASWGNTWYNALCEASYMTGLEQHADVVALAAYAPLFCNENYVNWKPDLIWFNNHEVRLTPNYEVQKQFMLNQGEETIPVSLSEFEPIVQETEEALTGDILLGTDDTTVQYTDIAVRNADTGEIRTFSDIQLGPKDRPRRLDTIHWNRYTIRVKAKRLEGQKGFCLCFARKDDDDQLKLTVGGWQNQDLILTQFTGGRGSDLSQYLFTVKPDQIYDLTIRVDGREVTVYVDQNEYQDLYIKPLIVQPLYTSCVREDKDWILKVVNVTEETQRSVIDFEGRLHMSGTRLVMRGKKEDTRVSTQEDDFTMQSGDEVAFPPMSLTILKVHERFLEK